MNDPCCITIISITPKPQNPTPRKANLIEVLTKHANSVEVEVEI
jgi:hypothetical protein